MRVARFRTADGAPGFGIVEDDTAVELDHRVASFDLLLTGAYAAVPTDPRLPLGEVRWEPPLGDHPKILCVGLNYAAHGSESGRDTPSAPSLFVRFPDSLLGAGTPVVRPAGEDSLDWEGEVGLVIGKPGRRIAVEDGWSYIAGFTCVAENSVRDWQQHSTQATAGKNWAGSGAVGPWLTTADEIGTGPLRVSTRLNGETVQDDTTDRLTFSFGQLVAYISTFTPLRPGDLIATGTPSGVGVRRDPPRFLRPGDELEVEVSGVGVLRHGVIDEADEVCCEPRETGEVPG
jgi:2-keto-4-pentenoate hydratase/2-oxohepta-3-ene-1,7-dioic acid hydratase in catechol pathway